MTTPKFLDVHPERDKNTVTIRLFVGGENSQGVPGTRIIVRTNKVKSFVLADTDGRAEHEFTLIPGEHRHIEIELAAFGGQHIWRETFRGRRL